MSTWSGRQSFGHRHLRGGADLLADERPRRLGCERLATVGDAPTGGRPWLVVAGPLARFARPAERRRAERRGSRSESTPSHGPCSVRISQSRPASSARSRTSSTLRVGALRFAQAVTARVTLQPAIAGRVHVHVAGSPLGEGGRGLSGRDGARERGERDDEGTPRPRQ